MPPRRPPLVLHDTVDALVQRLPSHYQNILELPQDATATRNALRLLATQVPVGTLGAHDRPECRAAVLLEYVVRSRAAEVGSSGSSSATKKTFKELGKVVGIKETTFKQLHSMIGHYYHDQVKETSRNVALTTQHAPRNSKRKQAPQTTAPQQQPARKQKSRRGEISDSLLSSLAIRLASHLADPHGMARRARILYHQLRAHALATLPTAADRRGQEHDFGRYAAAYQCAVLYYVTTVTDESSSSRAAVTRLLEDENAVRPLKLEDLVRACPECKLFDLREKLTYVERWAQELQKQQQLSLSSQFPQTKKSRQGATEAFKTPTAAASTIAADDVDESPQQNFDFAKWKEFVLDSVLAQTRASQAPEGKTLERASLLTMASHAILSKYGLC